MLEHAVMEAHLHLSSVVEPIGRKPFLKKWIDQDSTGYEPDSKRSTCLFEDTYRFLFQILEQDNLELAYRFRFTVEATGAAPFIKRQNQLDRALKRAKNKAYEPLEKLLLEIPFELGLDYEPIIPAIKVTRPLLKEILAKDAEFKSSLIPFIHEISEPEMENSDLPQSARDDSKNLTIPPKLMDLAPLELDNSESVEPESDEDEHSEKAYTDPHIEIAEEKEEKEIPNKLKKSATSRDFQNLKIIKEPADDYLEDPEQATEPDIEFEERIPEITGNHVKEDLQTTKGEKEAKGFQIPKSKLHSPPIKPKPVEPIPDVQPNDELYSEISKDDIPISETRVPQPDEIPPESDIEPAEEDFIEEAIPTLRNLRHGTIELKATDFKAIPLEEDEQDDQEEIHPNLPSDSQEKNKIATAYVPHVPHIPIEAEEEIQQEIKTIPETAPAVKYSPAGFKLPTSPLITQSELEQDIKDTTESSPEATDATSYQDEKKDGLIDSTQASPAVKHADVFKRIVSPENDSLPEKPNKDLLEIEKPTIQIPPPIYKFKFETKRRYSPPEIRRFDPGVSLVISRDCIERRSETKTKKNHFLVGSSAWHQFQKRTEQSSYIDPNALVIQRDCIENRIENIDLPSNHALEIPESMKDAFGAFDTYFKEEYDISTIDNGFDPGPSESDFPYPQLDLDMIEDPEMAKEIHEHLRSEVYQKSLDHLNNRDGTLFDYLSGKISIDGSDKFEIEKWVRAQHSEPTAMYRAYAEAIMQSKTQQISEIQEIARFKLKPEDLPPQRVRDIFDRLKEGSDSIHIRQRDIVTILRRQDYLSGEINEEQSGVTFSHGYSRYKNWRHSVESPVIEVRQIDTTNITPTIPVHSLSERWSFPSAPLISVRTSSDYKRKHTLPVFDKVSSWRKSVIPLNGDKD